MDNIKLQELLKLSRDERLVLVQTLWDSISGEQDELDINKEHIIELKKRLQKISNGTARFIPWEDVKNTFESK